MISGAVHVTPQPIVLLVPDTAAHPGMLHYLEMSTSRYEAFLSDMQRLRGSVYLRDGAIRPDQLTRDGRHRLEVDERSWNVLLIKSDRHVIGCARYLQHENTVSFDDLKASESALARSPEWGDIFREAVETQIALARHRGVRFVELGGWAVADELRGTSQAMRIAMATFGLGRLLGGCLGITTATSRNRSSSMLRRFGGASLITQGRELQPYFDPYYNCEMEVLQFDSDAPSAKFESWIGAIQSELADVSAVSRNPAHTAIDRATITSAPLA